MRKAILITAAAAAALSLSACGKKAKNEAAEAAQTDAGDGNVMGEAVKDQLAAENAAFGAAENSYDAAPPANAAQGSSGGDGSED